MSAGVVIAGGGLAAQRCCETLRSRGFDGGIRMVSEENRPPYDRPPLSKAVLSGERDPASLGFRAPEWYTDHAVELILGERAVALDPTHRAVALASGQALPYESLVVATGSRPRVLPGTEHLLDAHTLRTADDAVRLAEVIAGGGRLVIVGAGFIGLEVAATARRAGLQVTVLEAAPAPLLRVLGPELAGWFTDLHRAEGVEIVLCAQIARFGHASGGTEWVQLADGRRLEGEAVLIGVGIEPATEWLTGCGLDAGGVRVDLAGRTTIPDVYAAGDAARTFNRVTRAYERSEQWEAAARQGAQVARAILGLPRAPAALPSFWTDQYGLRIQLVGDARDADEVRIDGDPAGRDFEALILRAGTPIAGLAVGRPRALARLRAQLQPTPGRIERSDNELSTPSR